MAFARVVTSTFPVVLIVCPPSWSEGWVEELDRAIDAVFRRGEPFAIITDTRPAPSMPDARDRKRLTDWLIRPDHLARQKRWNAGSSTIIASTLMRGALQAIYWVWTPPAPQHTARDLEDAWPWVIAQLERRGVVLPRPAAELLEIAREEIARERE